MMSVPPVIEARLTVEGNALYVNEKVEGGKGEAVEYMALRHDRSKESRGKKLFDSSSER